MISPSGTHKNHFLKITCATKCLFDRTQILQFNITHDCRKRVLQEINTRLLQHNSEGFLLKVEKKNTESFLYI